MWLKYRAKRNLLVSSKGHPFDREAFASMFDAIAQDRADLSWTHVEQPATLGLCKPEAASAFAAMLFYDVPGVELMDDGRLRNHAPPQQWRDDFESLLEAGMPMIFLHHAIAGWPVWPRYAEIMGGRYLFEPTEIDGEIHGDSGYVHDVAHHVVPVSTHPVTAGLDGGFDLTGELYLCEIFADDLIPLMRCDSHIFDDQYFWSSREAVEGRLNSRAGWSHPPGSDLVAWIRREKNSPILYLQGGHDRNAFENAGFRRLLGNAIDWITGEDARVWARSNN